MVRKHIPNLLTLLNLACGTVAIVLTLEGQWQWGVYLMLAAAGFDFLDGFAAKMLNARSETGGQLDSLADMVSFGVLPAIFIYTIFKQQLDATGTGYLPQSLHWIILISVVIVPALSAIRLARFNLQEESGPFFSGLPTPAHALFWAGIFWQFMNDGTVFGTPLNLFFLLAIMLIMALHMIMPVPMYSLKFEHFKIRGNMVRYLLILSSVIILAITGLPGLSLVVLVYILLSLMNLLLSMRVSK
ncbi:MAG: CDP-alcohol phosphatidyltransferase family protein [Bacteroidota bacterium]